MEEMVDGGLVERNATPFFVIPQAGHNLPLRVKVSQLSK
jgi:hypothetical protein